MKIPFVRHKQLLKFSDIRVGERVASAVADGVYSAMAS